MTDDLDYCEGCAMHVSQRVSLPMNWKEGDPVPENVTRHSTKRDPRVFVFRGHPAIQDRVYLKEE